MVEVLGSLEADFLLHGEEKLDARVRPPFGEKQARCLEENCHGSLVVGAEDRSAFVADEAVLPDNRADLTHGRNSVHMRAEEDRAAAVTLYRLEPREQIAGV